MPYDIKPVEGGFDVLNSETGEKKNKTPHKTRKEAVAHRNAMLAAEGMGSKKMLPKKKKPTAPEEKAPVPIPNSLAGQLPPGMMGGPMPPMPPMAGGVPPMKGMPGLM